MRELEDLYDDVLNESNDPKVWASGDCPTALGDSELASETTAGARKDKEHKEPVENDEKNDKQHNESLKFNQGNINNNMNDKQNIFDRLYSTIMEDGEEFDMGGLDAGLEEPSMGDEMGGGEVTLTLTADQADALKGLLSQLEGPEGDDIEDLDDEGGLEMGEEDFVNQEAVDAQHTGQGQQPGHDPTNLGPNKKNVVPGDASKTSTGGASSDVTDKIGNDGNLKDTTGQMTSTGSRSNVVTGRVSGNNQNLFS